MDLEDTGALASGIKAQLKASTLGVAELEEPLTKSCEAKKGFL